MNTSTPAEIRTKAVETAFEHACQKQPRDYILADLKTRFKLDELEAEELCTLGRLKSANRTAIPMLVEGKSVEQIEQHFQAQNLLEPSELHYLQEMLKGMASGFSEALKEAVGDKVSLVVSELSLNAEHSDKRILPAFILCLFLGVFGIHRFYVGKIVTGLLQLCTLGGFGLWTLVDMVMLLLGRFTDTNGLPLKHWK